MKAKLFKNGLEKMMPSVSKKQHNFMEMIAHSPAMAKKAGVPQSVGQDFATADKGKKFRSGGMAKDMESKSEMRKEMAEDKKQDVSLITKAFKQHDSQEHKGSKGTTLKLSSGGSFRKSANGVATKGLTKGTMVSMCGGGMMGKKGK
jgi:hypothetical protein